MIAESDYANYLIDPDFFIKKKERDAASIRVYVSMVDKYSRGQYHPVKQKANIVIADALDNIYRSKYMLLKAMCMGQTETDKDKLLPVLEQLLEEYPESDEAPRAREMIGIIKNGYSENLPYDFSSKSPFRYVDTKTKIIVFLEGRTTSNSAKTRISNFNREYFSREHLKVDSKIYGTEQGMIIIDDFDDDIKAASYIRAFKATKKHLLEIKNAKIFIVTKDNLRVIILEQKLKEYEEFYLEYY